MTSLTQGCSKIGIIGAGGWGTTLANLLAEKGMDVSLWVHGDDVYQTIVNQKENVVYLPQIILSKGIYPTQSLEEASQGKDVLVLAVPSHVFRGIASKLKSYVKDSCIIVSATKGIENDTLLTMSGILKEILPFSLYDRLVCLSGPSFAREVAERRLTAVTVASRNQKITEVIQTLFTTPFFRVYTSLDVIGVELGGALKNVIAIGAGISDGLCLGYNTRAALITRGIAEISRLGVRLGANPLTFAGLAGIGDLILTCTADLSRNRTVGLRLGRGMSLSDILADMRMVAEGITTTKSAYDLSKRLSTEMPITEQIYHVLYRNKSPKEAVKELMGRAPKDELERGFFQWKSN